MLRFVTWFVALFSIADSLKCYECTIFGIKKIVDGKEEDLVKPGICDIRKDCMDTEECGNYTMTVSASTSDKTLKLTGYINLCAEKSWSKTYFTDNCDNVTASAKTFLKNFFHPDVPTYQPGSCGELDKCETNLCNDAQRKGAVGVVLVATLLTYLLC